MDGAPYKLEPIHQARQSVAMMPAPASARPPRALQGGIAGPRARGTSQEEIRALLRRTTLALDRIVRIRESMEPFVDFAQFDKPPRPSAGRRSSATSDAISEPAPAADARSTPASSYGSTASSSSLSSDDPDGELASTRSVSSTRSTSTATLLQQSTSLSVTDEDELLPAHAATGDNRSTSGGRSTTQRSTSVASSLSRIEDDEDDDEEDDDEDVPPFKEARLERLKHIEITFVEGLPREFYMALARFLFSVVDIKTRHSRFNFYKDTFTGADAVREMVLNGFCDDQQAALRFGNVLVRLGLVEHVSRTDDQLHNSKDNFYRFTKLVEAQVGVGDASDEFARDTVARSRRASSVAAYRESVMASRESAAVGNLVEYDFTEASDEVHALVTDEALLILSKVLLKVFERKNKLLFYKGFVGCFLGAEAVNVLRELRIATSLIDAVLIGQAMLDEALIEPIASSAAGSFQDKYVFYRLTKAAAAHGAAPPMAPLSAGSRPPSTGSRPASVSSQSSVP